MTLMSSLRTWLRRLRIGADYIDASSENLTMSAKNAVEASEEVLERSKRTKTKIHTQRRRVARSSDAITKLVDATRHQSKR